MHELSAGSARCSLLLLLSLTQGVLVMIPVWLERIGRWLPAPAAPTHAAADDGRERPVRSPPARAVAPLVFEHVEASVPEELGLARGSGAALGADGG
ncbi:hypothetical protein PG997_005045 [Apiospora hydei]|uniref:Uncharacterized protein n=1 Tax=Apiospora hydei TaxID=1337664 RepID=A0ABR1X3U1_9PEZI